MWRSLKYVQKSRKMESGDRRQIYGETARANKQTSGERLKVHLWRASGGAQTDGCLSCQKRDGNSPPTNSQPQRVSEVVSSVT